MSEQQTPLEQAEAVLRYKDPNDDSMVAASAWSADGATMYFATYGTLRALVAQIRLDEQRLADHDRIVVENEELRTLNSWWSHLTHPADRHEATPMPPKSACTYMVGRGAEGTAPCGYPITLHEERSTLMADGSGGRQMLVWHHEDRSIDHMHTPRPEGPKWPST